MTRCHEPRILLYVISETPSNLTNNRTHISCVVESVIVEFDSQPNFCVHGLGTVEACLWWSEAYNSTSLKLRLSASMIDTLWKVQCR